MSTHGPLNVDLMRKAGITAAMIGPHIEGVSMGAIYSWYSGKASARAHLHQKTARINAAVAEAYESGKLPVDRTKGSINYRTRRVLEDILAPGQEG